MRNQRLLLGGKVVSKVINRSQADVVKSLAVVAIARCVIGREDRVLAVRSAGQIGGCCERGAVSVSGHTAVRHQLLVARGQLVRNNVVDRGQAVGKRASAIAEIADVVVAEQQIFAIAAVTQESTTHIVFGGACTVCGVRHQLQSTRGHVVDKHIVQSGVTRFSECTAAAHIAKLGCVCCCKRDVLAIGRDVGRCEHRVRSHCRGRIAGSTVVDQSLSPCGDVVAEDVDFGGVAINKGGTVVAQFSCVGIGEDHITTIFGQRAVGAGRGGIGGQ